MTLLVHGARQHEEGDLVDARHGLKPRLAELCTYCCEMPTLKMGLGERRIIIASEREVVERPILAHEVDEELVDRIVLLAPSHPVREGFLRDEAREELILLALAAREPLDLLLVAQEGIAEDVRPIAAVVLRLLMSRCLARARRAHDRAKDVERHLGMCTVQLRKARRACEDLCTRFVVLARADEAAVNHRIRGDDRCLDPGLCDILMHPCPELIGMSQILTAAEQLGRRNDDLVACLGHDIRRLRTRDRAAVMRDEDDLLRHGLRLCRVRRLRLDPYG